ncbi:hypothetical protein C4J81_13750 [Deltaproteobacteria bacterium Smac51]|nr:hypothetical protein C4J81_13750 [Deltaproteobacteria bacterium Smac51]
MKPINRKWLPHTVTLFNLYRDPNNGEMLYFRTFLDGVRIDSRKTRLDTSPVGAKKIFSLMAFIDPASTRGYEYNDSSKRLDKPFKQLQAWRDSDINEKKSFWTLNDGDWLVFNLGGIVTECPDINGSGLSDADFKNTYGVRALSSLNPSIDKSGLVHHWEVILD